MEIKTTDIWIEASTNAAGPGGRILRRYAPHYKSEVKKNRTALPPRQFKTQNFKNWPGENRQKGKGSVSRRQNQIEQSSKLEGKRRGGEARKILNRRSGASPGRRKKFSNLKIDSLKKEWGL